MRNPSLSPDWYYDCPFRTKSKDWTQTVFLSPVHGYIYPQKYKKNPLKINLI